MFESSGDGAAGLEVEAPWWLDVPGFDDDVDVDALVAGADAVFAEGDEEHLALVAGDAPDDVVMPEPLAELPVESMTADEALDAVVAVRGVQARLEARAMELLAHAAGPTASVRDVIVPDAVGGGRVVRLVDEVLDELGAALRLSPVSVFRQVQRARMLTGPLPGTFDALATGRISPAHASVIVEQASRMLNGPLGQGPDCEDVFALACARLEEQILPTAEASTPGKTEARARKAVLVIDAAGESARRDAARRHRDVTARGLDDGLAQVSAVLAATDAVWVHALVDQLARDAIADGTIAELDLDADATLGEVRAAVFLRLLRGDTDTSAAARAVVGVEVQVLVDAATLAGLDEHGTAAVQVGHGEPTNVGRDDLIDLITDPATPTRFRRLVCDPLTGALVDRGAKAYAINADLAAWITARDVTCRFPGCTRRARSCDVDHATDFADGGATTVANLGALCRRHHNAKTHAGWRIEDPQPDGSCEFISPLGRRYRHIPEPLTLPPERELNANAPDPPPRASVAVIDDEAPPF
jgi:hypothetical protein